MLLISIFFSSSALAIFCPTSASDFRTIHKGDTVESVLATCGKPLSQKTYNDDVAVTVSEPVGGRVTTVSGMHSGNVVSYRVDSREPTYVNSKKINRRVITELQYPLGVLQFENGILIYGWATR